jgi:hypothetical protein
MDKPPLTISRNKSNNKFDVQTNTDVQDHVAINDQIILTKDQFELLKIISDAHNKSISEYIQHAIIETMKTEIEFGDFCDILLDKLDPERELM